MGINSFQLAGNNYNKCKTVFELLNCNLLWIINSDNLSLNIMYTDRAILDHYLEKKYYIYDPNVNLKPYINSDLEWEIFLGSDSETFTKSGFLYDLYKMFNIEEFVSIEHNIGSEKYCYRFFTRNNRFVFMNQLLKHITLIKHFMTNMAQTIKQDTYNRFNINTAS